MLELVGGLSTEVHCSLDLFKVLYKTDYVKKRKYIRGMFSM
jgi:hypothetical protein